MMLCAYACIYVIESIHVDDLFHRTPFWRNAAIKVIAGEITVKRVKVRLVMIRKLSYHERSLERYLHFLEEREPGKFWWEST